MHPIITRLDKLAHLLSTPSARSLSGPQIRPPSTQTAITNNTHPSKTSSALYPHRQHKQHPPSRNMVHLLPKAFARYYPTCHKHPSSQPNYAPADQGVRWLDKASPEIEQSAERPTHPTQLEDRQTNTRPASQPGRQADRQTGRQADRQTGRQAGRQAGRQTERQADRQADRQSGRQSDRQAGRQAGRQTDRQQGRQTDRQAGRQTDRQAGRQTGRQAGRQAGRQTGRQAGRQTDRHKERTRKL